MKKNIINKKNTTSRQPLPSLTGGVGGGSLFFILSWIWASWWMGDVLRVAYERSFFTIDPTLMHWLWQRSYGPLWIVGRALLTMCRWPLVGGLVLAALLTLGSWLFGYCLRMPRWRHWLQFLPAAAWMLWTAHVGINLYYMRDPGRIFALPLLFVLVFALLAIVIRFRVVLSRQRGARLWKESPQESSTPSQQKFPSLMRGVLGLGYIFLLFALPMFYLNHRHPYLRPLTHMEVQLMNDDFEGIVRSAHKHPAMSYRQMAGFYVIALARTGQLAEQLFDIKLQFDTIRALGYKGKPSACYNYHLTECNYHAGQIRAARHSAVEELTMDGPSLHTLKQMVKISLIEQDWQVARKYLQIIKKTPFEWDFVRKYEQMIGHADLVQADPEFAFIIKSLPPQHVIENIYEKPCFLGYYVKLKAFTSSEEVMRSALACLYSKRMPDFLQRCQQYIGTMPPRSIAEGLVIEAQKNPNILKIFPQLQMDMERFGLFVEEAIPYMENRRLGAEVLFEKYHGYYPYYYYFGNLPPENPTTVEEEPEHNKAGVN